MIKNIVFDVGRVIIDFSYHDLFLFLQEAGIDLQEVAIFAEKTKLAAYERGEISSETFVDNLDTLLPRSVDRDILTQKWLGIFEPIPEMIAFARKLKSVCRVYLLSNTSALHWTHLRSEYQLDEIAHGMLASFEVGVLKPDAGIFRAAEARFGLDPAETLFIDDLAVNVAGAERCHWQAIHHESCAQTIEKVSELITL